MTHDRITPDYPTPPSDLMPARRSPWQYIIDHNPFYLFSVLLMLFGCHILNNSLNMAAGDLGKIVILLAILNLYECLLIGLGIYLLPQKGIERDGRILLLLEALFLADATFLNAETVMTSPLAGGMLNAILLALALGKVWLILRAMHLPITPWRFGFLALQLAILWAMPFLFRRLGNAGEVTPLQAFAAWWIIGMLPVMYDLLAKFVFPAEKLTASGEPRVSPAVARVYLQLPFISLIAHLGFIHWIYQIDFYMADISPVLLGLAVSMNFLKPGKFANASEIVFLRIGLAVTALLFTGSDPRALRLDIFGSSISPTLMILAGTYLTLAYCFAFRRFGWFLLVLAVAATLKVFGPSFEQIAQWIDACVKWIDRIVNRMIPTTATGWGILTMIASFIMLLLGVAVSYVKGQRAR